MPWYSAVCVPVNCSGFDGRRALSLEQAFRTSISFHVDEVNILKVRPEGVYGLNESLFVASTFCDTKSLVRLHNVT